MSGSNLPDSTPMALVLNHSRSSERPLVVALITWLWLFIILGKPLALTGHSATQWAQFRGPNGSGVATVDKPPVEFSSTTNLLWRIELPSGHSSPCVWNDRLFLTAFDKDKLETLCVDRASGRILWRQTAPAEQIEKVHEFSNPAASTPASDGKQVYVYFGSYGLLAYDFEGNQKWRKPLVKPANGYGTATSPILFGELLLMLCDSNDGKSYLVAVDRTTGKTVWQKDRPLFTANWSTPSIWNGNGTPEIIVAGSGRLVSYDPKDGAERWWVNGFALVPICVPVAGEDLLYACVAGHGLSSDDRYDLPDWPTVTTKYDVNKDGKLAPAELPAEFALHLRKEVSKETPGNYFPMSAVIKWFDSDKDGLCSEKEWAAAIAFVTERKSTLIAIRPGGHGDSTTSHMLWKSQRSLPEMPSPIYYEGRLFGLKDGGILSCFDPKTGEIRYQERLGVSGQYCASLVAADGKLYAASVSGTVIVFTAGAETIRVLARNTLDERIVATPAIADNKLFVRTTERLWAFGR